MNELLNLKIEEYKSLQEQMDGLKSRIDALKGEIVEGMKNESVEKVELSSGTVATLTNTITYKYTDEPQIISYLKEKGLTKYITEKVNTTPLNTELKKGVSLTEDLKPYYIINIVPKLTVK